ncbi:MAG: glutathione synthase [Desulfosarcina sp.]|nr:glutathione synthase [Desulfobacterales bacterium]
MNRLCAGRDPDPDDLAAMQAANAVILPQGCRETLYKAARHACPLVFPNYDARFAYPGKRGQVRLFRQLELPHPESLLFANISDFESRYPAPGALPLAPPVVVKRDWGGEGQGVFPAPDPDALNRILKRLKETESDIQNGFVIQRFIPTRPRVLRVVVIGSLRKTYWRVMAPSSDPYAKVGLSLGGRIDYTTDPDLMRAAEAAVGRACRHTGINLAAFDILFCSDTAIAAADTPILLEINYFFGRKGLGGSEAFYALMQEGIRDWLGNHKQTE